MSHDTPSIFPTLADFAANSRNPFDKAELVHWLVVKNLQRPIHKGHGNRARRRIEQKLGTNR